MHKADREGLLTKDVIQFLMSEEKPNQRETVKIPTESCENLRQMPTHGSLRTSFSKPASITANTSSASVGGRNDKE